MQTKQIRTGSQDPKPKTDLGGTSGKNTIDRLERSTREFARSVTETSSKVRELTTYDETINDPIHGNR